MGDVVNLALHRRMRMLQKGVDDIKAGRGLRGPNYPPYLPDIEDMVFVDRATYLKGREHTSETTRNVPDYIKELQEEMNQFVPVRFNIGSGRVHTDSPPAAQVLPFKRPSTD